MINILITLTMIIMFFLSGRIYESIKYLLMLLTDVVLKILNVFGIQINRKEHKLKTSKCFKNYFKEIKIVKKSKENNKLKPSINLPAALIFVLNLSIIVINADAISGGIITKILYSLPFMQKIIYSEQSMDVILTAIAFSCISFSISKLINQWNDTKKYRKARKEIKIKNKVLKNMSSKELLDIIKIKDEENLLNSIDEKEKIDKEEEK